MPDGTVAGAADPTPPQARTHRLAIVAAAVQATAAGRELTAGLAAVGVPVMVLRGPPVQLRLLGSDAAYRSADLDLLIRPRHRRRAFEVLSKLGWRFASDNGVLWRLDRAAAFLRNGVTVDLHWGLHAFWVSPRHLRSLERAFWAGGSRTADGWHEPPIEALVVYFAVHGAASGFHKPAASTLVKAASDLTTDWAAVEALARDVHLWSTVQYALGRARGETPGPPPPIFDGAVRRFLGGVSRRARTLSAVPAVRRAILATRRRRRGPGVT
ncbi:MAG: nucleotidyltransferase family protein [Acidimicrobiales bacterium]